MTFQADTIVGIGSDFLGDWQGGGYEKGYAETKRPVKEIIKQKCLGICNLN